MKNYYDKTLYVVTRTKSNAWNINKPMRSQEGWDEHAVFMDKLTADGFILLGGPLGKEGITLLIIEASNENEIREKLSQDNWSQMNILEIKDIQPWNILLQSK
jgi:uncharacterized protein YciI